MLKVSPNTDLDTQGSQATETTPLLADSSSSEAPLERKGGPARIYTDWNLHSRTRGAQSKGKHSIHQKSPSSLHSIWSDGSDKENGDFESSRRRRRMSPSFASAKQRNASAPSSSITLEDEDQRDPSAAIENSSHGPNQSYPSPESRSLCGGFLCRNVSLRLENSGSVARDHLASERTFLAYMRTSLAIAASGVALVQLFSAASSAPEKSAHRLHLYIQPLGATTIVISLIVLFIGITRYFTIQSALVKGYFPAARLATGFIAVLLTALVTSTFGILMAGKLVPTVY